MLLLILFFSFLQFSALAGVARKSISSVGNNISRTVSLPENKNISIYFSRYQLNETERYRFLDEVQKDNLIEDTYEMKWEGDGNLVGVDLSLNQNNFISLAYNLEKKEAESSGYFADRKKNEDNAILSFGYYFSLGGNLIFGAKHLSYHTDLEEKETCSNDALNCVKLPHSGNYSAEAKHSYSNYQLSLLYNLNENFSLGAGFESEADSEKSWSGADELTTKSRVGLGEKRKLGAGYREKEMAIELGYYQIKKNVKADVASEIAYLVEGEFREDDFFMEYRFKHYNTAKLIENGNRIHPESVGEEMGLTLSYLVKDDYLFSLGWDYETRRYPTDYDPKDKEHIDPADSDYYRQEYYRKYRYTLSVTAAF